MKEEYIGEGTYGCVFKNPKKCDIEISIKNTIVKIFLKKETYDEELINQKQIEKIFNKNKNIIVSRISNCEKKLCEYDKEVYNKCTLINNDFFISDNQIIYQIIYEYGGIDLIHTIFKTKIKFKNLFKSFKNVFEGLDILSKKQYVHHDVRLPNILYNTKTKQMKIIDFGFLVNKKDVLSNNYNFSFAYNQSHHNYIPELNKENFIKFYNHIIHDIIENNYQNVRNKNNIKKLQDIITLMHNMYKSYIKFYNIEQKFDIKKIDIYMLGVSILELYTWKIILNNADINHNKHLIVLNFLTKLIEINVKKRYNAAKAHKEYMKIIKLI